MVDIGRAVLFAVVGFCIGSIAVGLASTSAMNHGTTVVSTQYSVQTLDSTVTLTKVQTDPMTSTQDVTLTQTDTSTATAVSTVYSNMTLTSYSSSYLTVTSTTSVTATESYTSTLTSTSTITQTTTVTNSATSTANSTSSLSPIVRLAGNGTQTSMDFASPSTNLSLEFTLTNSGGSQSGSLTWIVLLSSSFNPVAQGTVSGPGQSNVTVTDLIKGDQYVIEVIPSSTVYDLEVYQQG